MQLNTATSDHALPGKIVVDVKEEEKNLTVEDLMRLFQQNSGEIPVSDDRLG